MVFCEKCGKPMSEDDAFCAYCGTPVAGKALQTVGVRKPVSSGKMVDKGQLPQPIKGTGLAKGLIPLYLSVVCSSCTWS